MKNKNRLKMRSIKLLCIRNGTVCVGHAVLFAKMTVFVSLSITMFCVSVCLIY